MFGPYHSQERALSFLGLGNENLASTPFQLLHQYCIRFEGELTRSIGDESSIDRRAPTRSLSERNLRHQQVTLDNGEASHTAANVNMKPSSSSLVNLHSLTKRQVCLNGSITLAVWVGTVLRHLLMQLGVADFRKLARRQLG
jgi:hypothetical protein